MAIWAVGAIVCCTYAALVPGLSGAWARGEAVPTAEPDEPPAGLAGHIVVLPAQTMASDGGSTATLPMGSAYEIALLIIGDVITNRVRAERGESAEMMRGRHTNLE